MEVGIKNCIVFGNARILSGDWVRAVLTDGSLFEGRVTSINVNRRTITVNIRVGNFKVLCELIRQVICNVIAVRLCDITEIAII